MEGNLAFFGVRRSQVNFSFWGSWVNMHVPHGPFLSSSWGLLSRLPSGTWKKAEAGLHHGSEGGAPILSWVSAGLSADALTYMWFPSHPLETSMIGAVEVWGPNSIPSGQLSCTLKSHEDPRPSGVARVPLSRSAPCLRICKVLAAFFTLC